MIIQSFSYLKPILYVNRPEVFIVEEELTNIKMIPSRKGVQKHNLHFFVLTTVQRRDHWKVYAIMLYNLTEEFGEVIEGFIDTLQVFRKETFNTGRALTQSQVWQNR